MGIASLGVGAGLGLVGSFAGGLNAGYVEGTRLASEEKARDISRRLGLQQIEAGNTALANQQRDEQYKTQRQQLYQDLTTEPTQITDPNGTVTTARQKRSDLDDAGLRSVWSKMADFDAANGKITPDQALQFQHHVKMADREGVWDTIAALDKGDLKAAHKAFDTGDWRLAEGVAPVEVQKKDEFGTPYSSYKGKLVNQKTGEEKDAELDPMKLAYSQSGAAGYLSRQNAAHQARRDAEQMRKDDLRHQEMMQKLEVEGRRADAYSRGQDARVTKANSPGGGGGVTKWKYDAWLASHPDDTAGALDYASGKKSMGPREARLAAEKLVNAQKDEMGMPLSGAARKRMVESTYTNLMGAGGNPDALAANPAANPAAGALDLNRFITK
jgi:hypothetical protein